MSKIRSWLPGSLFMLAVITAPVEASTLLDQGSFSSDSNVLLQQFTVTVSEEVTIQSYGYAGGMVPTLPLPTTIAPGGFAPNAILFDGTGTEIASDNGGHCGITNRDSVTGNCDDPFIQQVLAAGNYTLALLVFDNVPNDGQLADGFKQDGNPGFTCAEFGASGNFCDVTSALGTVRTGNYAVSITGQDITATPEPATLSITLIAGLFLLVVRRSRRSQTPEQF